jgi:hypothetical protein
MGQRVDIAAQSAHCQPPKKRLDRTTSSRSKERDFLSNDRRRVESPKGACASGSAVKGEGEMTDNDAPVADADPHVNFDAPAVLRKWPSINKERLLGGAGPYLLVDGTLEECIREFMSKPASTQQLYEIYTSPQPPLVSDVLSGEIVVELARLRDFL